MVSQLLTDKIQTTLKALKLPSFLNKNSQKCHLPLPPDNQA